MGRRVRGTWSVGSKGVRTGNLSRDATSKGSDDRKWGQARGGDRVAGKEWARRGQCTG